MAETVHRYFPFSKENFIVPNVPSMGSLCQLLLFESKGSINIFRQLPYIGVEVKVGVVVFVKVGDGVMVGVLVLVYVGVVVGDRNGTELQLIEMRIKADRLRNIAFNEMYLCFIIVDSRKDDLLSAQRLAAQPVPRAMSIGDLPMRRIRERGPLGRFRYVSTILAGNLQSQFGILSLSLGQGLTPRVLSGGRLQPRVGRPPMCLCLSYQCR
jgi:hypothetical protein